VVLAPLFCFLSIEAVLQEDVHEGILETLVVQRVSLENYFLAKVLSHWILKGIPVSFLSWGIGVLNFSFHSQFSALLISLLFLTFIVIIWALLGMAVSNGIKNSGMVLLLIFPLIIPPFLTVQIILLAAQSGLEFLSYLVILSGILLMTCGMGIVAVPFMIRLILR
jgi:heme exporter protein B